MAAAGTSPALNLREKLAELAGLKQRVSPDLVRCDFTNLVTNGGFDTDTDWTKGTGWTIAAGVATGDGVTSSDILQQTFTGLTVGMTYRFSLGLTARTTGYILPIIRNAADTVTTASLGNLSTVATHTLNFVATDTSHIVQVYSYISDTSVDNITIYEADPSDDAPWLRLPYGYKVGQRGMIVRDGVVLHPSDYTEITDSGQTFIKPIVAPGVSTEFSIWAGA